MRTAHLRRSLDFAREERGSALIELGLVLACLGVPTLLGIIYIGVILSDSIEIANAAHAGAMYGMRSSTYSSETSYIISSAQAEAPDFGTNLTVTPTTYYACSNALDGTHYSTQTLANTACTGGTTHALEFLQVVASATVQPLGKVAGLPTSITLSSTSVTEVEE